MSQYSNNFIPNQQLSRRAFIKSGSLFMLAGLGAAATARASEDIFSEKPKAKIGLITDLHYADTDDRGSRNYRESLTKTEAAIEELNKIKLDCAVEIGDLIDALPNPTAESEIRFLKTINREIKRLKTDRHYVLGNHCIYSLTKPEFMDTIEQERSYYSFDKAGTHFVILDACYRKDGVDYGRLNNDWTDTDIPAPEREWLAADLKHTKHRTIVFVHQRLDLPVENEDAVHSSPAVRQILEQSGKVVAVFQGHSHVNDYRNIKDIHYCTLDAIIGGSGPANNAYSILSLYADGSLKLDGFAKHSNNPLTRGSNTA